MKFFSIASVALYETTLPCPYSSPC
jgi:hypothetical protein